MKKFSIEILPKQKDKIPDINKKYFNDVYITHIPGSPLKDLIETSEAVLNNNLNPVPHLPARSMESENDLNFLLNKLTKLGVRYSNDWREFKKCFRPIFFYCFNN